MSSSKRFLKVPYDAGPPYGTFHSGITCTDVYALCFDSKIAPRPTSHHMHPS